MIRNHLYRSREGGRAGVGLELRDGAAVAQPPRLVAPRRLGEAEAVLPVRRRLLLIVLVLVLGAAVVAPPPRRRLLLEREGATRRAAAGAKEDTLQTA